MPTEWRAPFRKLQERCSTSWLRLPAWVRGYGDEMIRFAERPYGRVCDTANAEDVAFRIRAHDSELEQVREAVRLLTAQEFLSTEQDGLYITNFPKAQENYEATRKREWREGQRETSETVPDRPDAHGTVPQEERRLDQRRSDKNKTHPNPPKREGMDGVRIVFEHWQSERKKPRAKLDPQRVKRIKARLSEGFTTEQLREAITNAKNDPFLMGSNNGGKVFDDLKTLLRDAAQVERLVDLKSPLPLPNEKPPGLKLHEETGRLPSNYKAFPFVPDIGRRVPAAAPRPQPPAPTPEELEAQAVKAKARAEAQAAKDRADRERWEADLARELAEAKGKAS